MYQNTINFERIRERQQTEGYIPKGRNDHDSEATKGRKLNKVRRDRSEKSHFCQ